MALTWPAELFPAAGGYAPFVRSLSGGQSLSGFEQVQPQLHDRWQASYTFHLGTSARLLAARAVLTALRGRANTVLLPAFDRNRAPRSATVPGSPIGTAVTDPPFLRGVHTAGAPLGGVVGSAAISRDVVTSGSPIGSAVSGSVTRRSITSGSPIGSAVGSASVTRRTVTSAAPPVVASPAFWRRWPAFEGLPYEFTSLAGITGTVTVLAEDRASLVPTGIAPQAGEYFTLAGIKREILSAERASGIWLLRFAPILPATPPIVNDTAVASGTATVAAADAISFALGSGSAPQVGDHITLAAAERTLTHVSGSGPYLCTFVPAIDIAAPVVNDTAVASGTATIAAADAISFALGSGSAPQAGDHITLAAAERTLTHVSGSGPYLCTFVPAIDIAAPVVNDTAVASGTATITAADRFSYALSSGAAPRPGDRITLAAAVRTLTDVLGNGPYTCVFRPALTVAPDSVSDITAATGTATIRGFDRFSFAATSGAPQIGDRITLFAVSRTLTDVLGSGPYLCIFTPTLFVSADTPGSIVAEVNASAAINAVLLDIKITAGVAPTPGHLFSLPNNRLHAISSVTDLGGGVYRCSSWPWLRAASSAHDVVNFAAPVCEMRLASDGEGAEALLAASLGKQGSFTLRFDEAAVIS